MGPAPVEAALHALRAEIVRAGQIIDTDGVLRAQGVVAQLWQTWGELGGALPAYQRRVVEQELKALEQAVKVRLAPRARFAFAKANKSSPTTLVPHPTPVDSSPATAAPSALPILSTPAATTVQGRRGEYLVRSNLALPSYPMELGSLVLSDLTDTCVNLLHSSGQDDSSLAGMNQIADDSRSFSAIHITNLIDCVVVLPSSSTGSIMVHNCDGCTFVVGAQQFRMHDARQCFVMLETRSPAIIERCTGITFSGYSALSTSPATYEIQDFDHPFANAESPSPNYSVLPRAIFGHKAWLTLESSWRDLLPSAHTS